MKFLNRFTIGGATLAGVILALVFLSSSENLKETATIFNWFSREPSETRERDGYVTYHHPSYLFSFELSEEYSVSSFEESGGEMIFFQKGASEASGFQVFILPFDEAGPITAERIKKDVPDMAIESPQQALLGKDKNLPALIFFSSHPSLGKTREVWFIRDGLLYQVTALAALDGELANIMGTIAFE